MILPYTCATVSIDGCPIDCASVEWEHAATNPEPRRHVDASASLAIGAKPFDRFIGEAFRQPFGASTKTLARRACYGGRKGRRALRRLVNYSLPIQIIDDLVSFVGKAVWTDISIATLHGMIVTGRWRL